MNIHKTAIVLMVTLLAFPVAAFYFGTNPNELQISILKEMAVIVLVVSFICFVVGELTRNNSQVDKLWSILPIFYAWFMTYRGSWNSRMVLMSVLITIWGCRLTYNFGRRGGYKLKFWEGDEDYRWAVLRQNKILQNKFVWAIFNLLFICIYQNGIIFLFTVPILAALANNAVNLNMSDYILAAVHLVIISLEYLADEQQFSFQTEKHRRIFGKLPLNEYADGFLQKGLWALMRHPNYACEQASWIVMYGFSIIATKQWLNWTIIGAVLLVILFKSSSDFSENITVQKYPKYKQYQAKVSRFIPFIY